MAFFLQRQKRKTRSSVSSGSDSDSKSPDEKRACELFNETTEQREAILSEADDEVLMALEMSEQIAGQLNLILKKLENVEGKLEDVVSSVAKLETAVCKIQNEVTNLDNKTTRIEKSVTEIDAGMSFLNEEVQELKEKEKKHVEEIASLNDRIIYQEVYNRRENLRFIGIQEELADEEDTQEVVYEFLEKELGIEEPRSIEFQRIHRVGKKGRGGQARQIIARFLRFKDRELVFEKARVSKERRDAKVLVDLPKEIRERRKQQWPKLNRARQEGKRAFFSRPEPDKLFIEGVFIPR